MRRVLLNWKILLFMHFFLISGIQFAQQNEVPIRFLVVPGYSFGIKRNYLAPEAG